HIPAAKSNYVKLYINGANWGIYPNVQQLNGDFLKEWFLSNDGTNWRADKPPGSPGGGGGWGDGTTALNYLGPDTNDYKVYYYLKSTNKTNPWDDLVNTCDALENTPIANLPTVLPTFLDIDRTLWFLASEVLFSDDDGYIYKGKMDYYVYWEAETGRITPQEYDGNSVMDPAHQSWSAFYNETNANYPLMNRLFAVPEYRQRYLAHLRTLISELYDTTSAFALINSYKAQIDTMVLNDPKKLYTYTQFNNEIPVLKNFINYRKNYLYTNTEVSQPEPVITNTTYFSNSIAWNPPGDMEDAVVNTEVSFVTGVFQVNLYYSTALVGNFIKTTMYDDGLHNDGAAADGIYGAIIPGQVAGSWVRFYIEAAANNPAKTVKYDPVGAEHNVYVYIVSPAMAADTSVAINEIMASNSTTAADGAGEYDDWIELYNNAPTNKDISGYYLTDNPVNLNKWQFPAGTVMLPNSYLIIWADEDSSQGAYHANFKLSASGEQLMLLNTSEELVDSISWGQQVTDMGFARVPNGTGPFIIQQPTFSFNNDLVSVEEIIPAQTSLTIYPNPSGNFVNIMVNDPDKNSIEISNIMGQNIMSFPYTERLVIQTNTFANGVYLVKCGSIFKKLIIEH
ncbi:MAG: CotH kinase family protein, partial [Bacteroidia bacterium]